MSTDVDWERELDFHIELRNYNKPEWADKTFTPSNEDRCNNCDGCKSGTCLSEANKYAPVLAREKIVCLNCDSKKACCVRVACSHWSAHPHLSTNWHKAVYDLNASLKKRYTNGQLTQLEGEDAWFVYKADSSQDMIQVGTSAQSAKPAETIDPVALQTALLQLNGGIQKLDKVISHMAADCKSLKDNQTQNAQNIIALSQQLEQQQLQQDAMRRELLCRQGEQSKVESGRCNAELAATTENIFKKGIFRADIHTPPKEVVGEALESSTLSDPFERLANILEKNLAASKPSVRLPAFSLPKITGVQNGELDSASFHLWKEKCKTLFLEHTLPDSLAVTMIQSEQSLPLRYRQQISSASTLAGIWVILGSMFSPIESLKPRLIRDLTSLQNAYTTEEQIATHDKILIKLNQILQFFPRADIDISQLTACLATFASPENLSMMPDTLAKFQLVHESTGKTYITLLRDHCQKRRGDLHQILTSLDLYRSDQATPHNNISLAKTERRREEGGSVHYWGGSKRNPGNCHLCKNKKSTHFFAKCDQVQLAKEGKITLRNTCLLCLRPTAACAEMSSKSKKPCHNYVLRSGREVSLLCQLDNHNHHKFLCKQFDHSKRTPHNFIDIVGGGGEVDLEVVVAGQDYEGEMDRSTNACSENPDCLANNTTELEEKSTIDARTDISHCFIDCRTKTDSPDVLFLMQRVSGSIQNQQLNFTVVFDGAAAISCILLPPRLVQRFKPDRKRNLNLTTAAGSSSQIHNVLDVLIYGDKNNFLFNVVNLQTLPLPRVRQDCISLFRNCGMDFLPTNFDINNNAYILFGLPHLQYHPFSVKHQMIPRPIRQQFNSLQCFISRFDGAKILAGLLTRNQSRPAACNVLSVENEHSAGTEEQLLWDDDDAENDVDCTHIWETCNVVDNNDDVFRDDDIFFSDIEDENDDSIYLSDGEEYCGDAADDTLMAGDDSDAWGFKGTHGTTTSQSLSAQCTPLLTINAGHPWDDNAEDGEGGIVRGGDLEEDGHAMHRVFQNKQNAHIKDLYRCFFKEQSNAFLATGHPDIGCHRCNPKISDFGSLTALRSYQLNEQISFKAHGEDGKGFFIYDRHHLPSVSCLPNGIKMCASRLTRTAAALQKLPHSLKYLNYSMATDHLSNKNAWLRDIPDHLTTGLQIVTTPVTLVRNLKSNSTLIRICQSANQKMPSRCDNNCPCRIKVQAQKGDLLQSNAAHRGGEIVGSTIECSKNPNCQVKLSINQTIPSFDYSLPQISTLALAARLAVIAAGGDIVRFFTNVKQSLKASLLNSLVMYRCGKTNYPTFSPTTDGVANNKEILICTSNYFGISDLSTACAAAAAKSVSVYMTHLANASAREGACALMEQVGLEGKWIVTDTLHRKLIFQIAKSTLEALYCDDWPHFTSRKQCMQYLQLTDADCNSWTEEKLLSTALVIQSRSAAFCILALNHCHFDFKRYETNSPNEDKLNRLIELIKHKVPIPLLQKPTNLEVRSEYLKKGTLCAEGSTNSAQKSQETEKPFLVQLGLEYYRSGTCSLRTKSIKLTSKKSKSKQIICSNVEEFDDWLSSEGGGGITRRVLAQLLGQCFSQHTQNFHLFPQCIIKFVTAVATKSQKSFQWEDCIDATLIPLIRAAIRLYFTSAKSHQLRCALQNTMHCTYVLYSASDAGQHLHCGNHILVQIVQVGSITRHIVQPLLHTVLLNSAKVLSLPHLELIALTKASYTTTKLYRFLEDQGILIHPDNVIICTDSASALAMAKCPPTLLESRFAHLCSKICVQLLTINLTPHQCLYFHSQSTKRRSEGEPFISDVCSKIDLSLPEDELVTSLPRQWEEAMRWFGRPVTSWSHLVRNPPNPATNNQEIENFCLTEAPMATLWSQKCKNTQVNFINKKEDNQNTKLNEHQIMHPAKSPSMPTTPFDNLLLRKFSRLNTGKSAFSILILTQWFILKLKKLVRMNKVERDDIRARLKQQLIALKNFAPFLPSCPLRCGLVVGVSCSKQHFSNTSNFFQPSTVLDKCWPTFDPHKTVKISNIFNILEDKINNLPWEWGDENEFLLREHVLTILSSYVSRGATVKNMRMTEVSYRGKTITIATGRRQAACPGGIQTALGTPCFRTTHSSVFALCLIRWHHLAAEHTKIRSRLSILKNGWLFQDLSNVLKSAQQMCMKCRLDKAANSATNTSLYTAVSGNSFNMGTLALSPNTHLVGVDAMGPFVGLNNTKYYCYVFVSCINKMVYSITVNSLSLQTLVDTIEQLTSFIGSCTTVISDQAGAFEMCATLLEVEGELDEDLPAARTPKHPLAALLRKKPIQGSRGEICWRLVCASSGEAMGSVEVYIRILKESLRKVDFYRKCGDFGHSEMASYFACATKCVNSRPCVMLEDGKVYSAYDILSFSLYGGGFPDHQLSVSSNNKQIKSKLDFMAKMKKDLQHALFHKYTKHLYFSSDFRQRGNFQIHSMFLETGDLVMSNKAFELTRSLTKSIRRIAFLDTHRKHAVVYHQIDPNTDRELNVVNFSRDFNSCKSKAERQNLVTQYLGRHSFESVDLRKCSFVAKQCESPHLDMLFRRSKDQTQLHPIGDDTVFDLHATEKLLQSHTPKASAVVPVLPLEAVRLASQALSHEKQNNLKKVEDKNNLSTKGKKEKNENNNSGNLLTELKKGETITKSGRISKPTVYFRPQ